MRKVLKRIIFLTIAFSAILAGINYVYGPFPQSRMWPSGLAYLSKMGTVLINPETILSSLNRGETDVFTPGIIETTDGDDIPMWSGPIHYPDAIPWTQADHLIIANAFNRFVWKDTLGDWNLFSMHFTTTCQENVNGLRWSEFRFFKSKFDRGKLSYSWRTIILNPEYGDIVWGEGDFPHPFREWKKIDLGQLTVTAEDALRIAEEHGGRAYRTRKLNNECFVSIWLDPQNLYGWSVSVGTLTMFIDPNTGEVFRVLDPDTGKIIKYVDPTTGEIIK
jgi:hypothetical protein